MRGIGFRTSYLFSDLCNGQYRFCLDMNEVCHFCLRSPSYYLIKDRKRKCENASDVAMEMALFRVSFVDQRA